MSLVDLQLNIKPAAWAVLHRLSEVEHPNMGKWRTTTWAWYNGRERGISLVIERYVRGETLRLIIVFGECRSSDSIFVDSWDGTKGDYMNGPKVEHLTDAIYEKRRQFPSVDKTAEYVWKLIDRRVG